MYGVKLFFKMHHNFFPQKLYFNQDLFAFIATIGVAILLRKLETVSLSF